MPRPKPGRGLGASGTRHDEVGLFLRRRHRRGRDEHAQPARRQGREPRGDVQSRAAGAPRLHGDDRGLHLFLRPREDLSAGAEGRGPGGARQGRRHHGQALRRCREPAPRLGPLGRPRLDARHDGHGAQPRPQRHDGRGRGQGVGRPPLRLRQLPALHHDVFQRRARPRPPPFRGGARPLQGPPRLQPRHRSRGRRLGEAGRRATRRSSSASSASPSRRSPRSSSGRRSAPSSAPG